MIAFIIARKKRRTAAVALENVDEKNLMVKEAVRNANQLNKAIRTSFKMRKKMFGINETK